MYPINKLFKKEEKTKSSWELQSEWVNSRYDNFKHNRHYSSYLYDFYNEHYDMNGKLRNASDTAVPIDFGKFDKDRIAIARDKEDKIKQKKLSKLANAKIKGLTNTERYLIKKAKLDMIYLYSEVTDTGQEQSGLKTDAELRQSIKMMRLRKKYKLLKSLDKKLRALESPTLKSFAFENFGRQERIEMYYESTDNLRNFVIAENDIEGMTEEEVKKHAMLEEI